MVAYQQISDGQVHEHRVYPCAGLASAFQDDRQHRDIAYGRYDQQYAVRDYGDHVALVERQVVRQFWRVEHGRVRHVVHARPADHRWRTHLHAFGDRLQHSIGVRVHYFHDNVGGGCGGCGGGGCDVGSEYCEDLTDAKK